MKNTKIKQTNKNMACTCSKGGNMFFYSRKVKSENPEEEDKVYQDSFNLNCVTRTYSTENEVLVILNDFHNEVRQVPIMNKNKKFSGQYKNQVDTVYSEIHLSKEDGERFKQLTEIQ